MTLERKEIKAANPKCVTAPAWQEVGHFVWMFQKSWGCPVCNSVRPIRKAEGREVFPTLRQSTEIYWWNSAPFHLQGQPEKLPPRGNKRVKLWQFKQSHSVRWKTLNTGIKEQGKTGASSQTFCFHFSVPISTANSFSKSNTVLCTNVQSLDFYFSF